MSAIVILGLKLPFRVLWEKVGVREQPICSCLDTPNAYVFCPYCGVRKTMRSLKLYKSRLTGEETTYRNVNTVMDHLYNKHLDLYDTNPRGYTDDMVYIYFTQPSCFLEVTNINPVTMGAMKKHPYELEDSLHKILGDSLWNSGEYGLWAFTTESSEEEPIPELSESNSNDNSDAIRSFIIPLGPQFKM